MLLMAGFQSGVPESSKASLTEIASFQVSERQGNKAASNTGNI